jgi:hypothetical protein
VQVPDAGHITQGCNVIGVVTFGRPDEVAAFNVFSVDKRVVAFKKVSVPNSAIVLLI